MLEEINFNLIEEEFEEFMSLCSEVKKELIGLDERSLKTSPNDGSKFGSVKQVEFCVNKEKSR